MKLRWVLEISIFHFHQHNEMVSAYCPGAWSICKMYIYHRCLWLTKMLHYLFNVSIKFFDFFFFIRRVQSNKEDILRHDIDFFSCRKRNHFLHILRQRKCFCFGYICVYSIYTLYDVLIRSHNEVINYTASFANKVYLNLIQSRQFIAIGRQKITDPKSKSKKAKTTNSMSFQRRK